MMPIIQTEALSFKYTGRKKEALHDVSLCVKEGETVLLLGASGTGKSTLALCLAGLIPHTITGRYQGRVLVAGRETKSTPLSDLAQQSGIVFQDPETQFATMTIEEEVAFGLENLRVPVDAMHPRIDEALARAGLLARRHGRIDHLSGGNKQHLALAALLAMRPRVLIFDEPTAYLDPVGTQEVFAMISELKQSGQTTLLLIEHKLDALIHLIDRVIVLATDGGILLEGSPRTVFDTHAATLLERGIWMPQVALLAHQLRVRGVALDPFPLTMEEATSALGKATQTSVVVAPSLGQQRSPLSRPREQEFAIEVRDLSASYGRQRVLDHISLQVPQGDFLAIMGANGAGKTTLAQHLVDILHPPRGTVWLNGKDVRRIPAHELLRQIGYVFQNPEHQFVTAAVEHELSFGLRLQKLPEGEIAQRVAQMLEQFKLSNYAQANPFTLSHGEKRRLSVATMLIVGQRTLILDEPTFGQDLYNAKVLLELLRLLHNEGCTIIVITHDMTLVAEYAEHVAVLSEGRLLFHGSTSQAFAQPALLRQARLKLPPLAEVAQRLAAGNPLWKNLYTVDHILAAMTSASHVK